MAKFRFNVVFLVLLAVTGWQAQSLEAAIPSPIFHLDFTAQADATGNMATDWGSQVSLVPGGGPIAGMNSGRWAGNEADAATNRVLIMDNPSLQAVALGSGSIVSWVKPDDGSEWNNIVKSLGFDADFGTYGIELQASGPWSGVFGAAQGWQSNNFGPGTARPPFDNGEIPTDTPSAVWTHAALTWAVSGTQATATIYRNGAPGPSVVIDPFNKNLAGLLGSWTIGGESITANPPSPYNSDSLRILRGSLADFAIFNVALDQAQIQEIMRTGIPPVPEPATFAIWSGLGLGATLILGRRKRQ